MRRAGLLGASMALAILLTSGVVALAATAEPTTLTLSASKTLVQYDGETVLSGTLSTSSGPLPEGKTVLVQRSTNGGNTWTNDGTATYDSATQTYRAARSPTRNVLFRLLFEGDASYAAATSRTVLVKAHAYLSQPVTPDTVGKNSTFTTYGYLKPRHSGYTRLYFYHYEGGRYRLHKYVNATNADYDTDTTRYTLRHKLPSAGRWRVRAYHSDANHAPTWSPVKEFVAQAPPQRVLGAFTSTQDTNSFNQTVGRPARIVQYFQSWGETNNSFNAAKMDAVVDSGARPMVTWMSKGRKGPTQPEYSNKNIYLNKTYDPYITQWATDARNWGNSCAEARGYKSPCVVFLRFDHEMNGYWNPWSAGVNGNSALDFVLAWRHVHDIFKKVGAKNVRWVWAGSTCRKESCSSLSKLYPGDRYVDWTALDGYNRWPESWRTGSQIFGDSYDQVTGQIAPRKPFMIPEVGCGEDPDDPSRKAEWLTRFFNSEIPNRLPKTEAVVYFSNDLTLRGRPNYAVDSSPQSLAAYREVAAKWRWNRAQVDITSPNVNRLVAADRTNTGTVLRKTSFRATFSEPMSKATLSRSTYKLFKCPTTSSTNCTRQITDVTLIQRTNGLRATLNPYGGKTTRLLANTRYKVVVTTEAKDAAGNFLDQNPAAAGYQQQVSYFKTARN